MTLGNATAARVRLIACAGNANIRSSPIGRDGCPVRRRNVRARLARAAGLLQTRQPRNRYGSDRDEAVRAELAGKLMLAARLPVILAPLEPRGAGHSVTNSEKGSVLISAVDTLDIPSAEILKNLAGQTADCRVWY